MKKKKKITSFDYKHVLFQTTGSMVMIGPETSKYNEQMN